MRRILFVDDEPDALEGTQAILTPLRPHWEMVFTLGGTNALSKLDGGAFDVVVTDFDMPGLDGAQLLARIQEEHSEVIRIVLSGAAEDDLARRVAHCAHQFLAKPCDHSVVYETVERTCALQGHLTEPSLRQAIGHMGDLPAPPPIYSEMIRVLADPKRSPGDVALLVARDGVLCAKILKIVNSSFCALAQPMTRIEEAVRYLGVEVIKALVLVLDLFGEEGLETLDGLQRHALFTGLVARRLASDPRDQQSAFVAGMLHDIGKVLLASRMPARFTRILEASQELGRPMHAVEQERGGVTHAEIGAYLLAEWGLPYTIVEAVAHHHAPDRVAQSRFDVLGAICVANFLVHEQERESSGGPTLAYDPLDEAYLEKLGVASKLEGWRELAAQELPLATRS